MCIYSSLTTKRVKLYLMKPSNRVQISKVLHYIQLTIIFLGKLISPFPLFHSQIFKRKYPHHWYVKVLNREKNKVNNYTSKTHFYSYFIFRQ